MTQLNQAQIVKPTEYVMHHQFNIQQLYALPTLYLCVLCLSENKQGLSSIRDIMKGTHIS